jgi:hypothetical protein
MVEDAVEAAVDPLWLMVDFETMRGYRWLVVGYVSHLDSQSRVEEFNSDSCQVVFAMAEGFVRADSTPTLAQVMAWPADHLPASGDPPRVTIAFDQSSALRWYNGLISDEDFAASWTWLDEDLERIAPGQCF